MHTRGVARYTQEELHTIQEELHTQEELLFLMLYVVPHTHTHTHTHTHIPVDRDDVPLGHKTHELRPASPL